MKESRTSIKAVFPGYSCQLLLVTKLVDIQIYVTKLGFQGHFSWTSELWWSFKRSSYPVQTKQLKQAHANDFDFNFLKNNFAKTSFKSGIP